MIIDFHGLQSKTINVNRKISITIESYRKTKKCCLPVHIEALERTTKMSLNAVNKIVCRGPGGNISKNLIRKYKTRQKGSHLSFKGKF